MDVKPISRNYFFEDRNKELRVRWICWLFTAVLCLVLFIFWEPLRSQAFMTAFADWRPIFLYKIFEVITIIGDDYGHIFFILIVYWCINKQVGFSTLMILLASAIYMYLTKGIFSEPRPIEGQELYDDFSFPSGHTLTTFAVWGYLAMRFRQKTLWIVASVIVFLVGISRIIIGVHFPGDIIGGFIAGVIFLAAVFWISRLYVERGWNFSISSSLSAKVITLGVLFSVLSVLVLLFYNSSDATMVVGFLAGLLIGNILEQSLIRFKTDGKWYHHFIKVIMGMGVLYFIARGLNADFLAEPHWNLLRFVITGFWVTLIAPFIFVITGLAGKEAVDKVDVDGKISA